MTSANNEQLSHKRTFEEVDQTVTRYGFLLFIVRYATVADPGPRSNNHAFHPKVKIISLNMIPKVVR